MFGDQVDPSQAPADNPTPSLDDMFGDMSISAKPEEAQAPQASNDIFSDNPAPVDPGFDQLKQMYN